MTPKVFISYSHDSEAHKRWVIHLATKLRENGIDASLDQWDLKPGKDLIKFMEEGINSSDRVLVICTDNYVKKANGGVGGVGYEKMILTGELAQNLGTDKFIPLVRSKGGSPSIPKFLGTRLYIDFSDESIFEEQFLFLLRELHKEPLLKKPNLGLNPFRKQSATEYGQDESIRQIERNDNAVSPPPSIDKLDAKGAPFVIKAWLDSGGNHAMVEPHVAEWLHRYGSTQEAVFVLNAWLNSGGDRSMVEPYVAEWLHKYGNTQEASFLIASWLDSGGDKNLVEPFMHEWLQRFNS